MIRYNTDGYTINPTFIVNYKWDQVTQSGFTRARVDNNAWVATVPPCVACVGSSEVDKAFAIPGRVGNRQSLRLP